VGQGEHFDIHVIAHIDFLVVPVNDAPDGCEVVRRRVEIPVSVVDVEHVKVSPAHYKDVLRIGEPPDFVLVRHGNPG
jgi:hypothetical protein